MEQKRPGAKKAGELIGGQIGEQTEEQIGEQSDGGTVAEIAGDDVAETERWPKSLGHHSTKFAPLFLLPDLLLDLLPDLLPDLLLPVGGPPPGSAPGCRRDFCFCVFATAGWDL